MKFDYSHDSLAGIYDILTDLISLFQTVRTKKYVLKKIGRNSSVLVVGCGNGKLAINVSKKGARVTGLDISKKMIENAKRSAKRNNAGDLKFICADFSSFEPHERYDYAVLPYFLNVFPDERTVTKIVKKARSLVKEGGYILITDEMDPKNPLFWIVVNASRFPVYFFFWLTTGMKYHRVHDLRKIMKKLNIEIVEEKRFWFQYCSVLIGKV